MPNVELLQTIPQLMFEEIVAHISSFDLDNRALQKHEFVAVSCQKNIIAFGRIKEHSTCSELCSLGVLEPKRLKGFGKKVVQALINKATQPLFLVCIIPDYFKPMGFEICEKYPMEIAQKLRYCTNELVVPEKYVVMQYKTKV